MTTELQVLRSTVIEVLREGGGSRPDVLRVGYRDSAAILKDQNGCDPLFARLLGPVLAWREARALRGLGDLPGVPALLGRPDRRSLLMEYVPATPIKSASHPDWPTFFDELTRLLRAMHRRGIAHCDLRSPDNTLVSDLGAPVLVDFVASVRDSGTWNPVGRWLFRRFCAVDLKAVTKLKSIVAPELIADHERHLLEHRSRVHRAVRGLGIGIRNVTRGLFTRW